MYLEVESSITQECREKSLKVCAAGPLTRDPLALTGRSYFELIEHGTGEAILEESVSDARNCRNQGLPCGKKKNTSSSNNICDFFAALFFPANTKSICTRTHHIIRASLTGNNTMKPAQQICTWPPPAGSLVLPISFCVLPPACREHVTERIGSNSMSSEP